MCPSVDLTRRVTAQAWLLGRGKLIEPRLIAPGSAARPDADNSDELLSC